MVRLGVVGTEEDPFAAHPQQFGELVELLGARGLAHVLTLVVDQVGAQWPALLNSHTGRAASSSW